MKALFEGDYNIYRLIFGLKIESGIDIQAENTLIIFDEVQQVPQAISSLKYFYENAPHFYIVAAGSLLGVSLHHQVSFPVGKWILCPFILWISASFYLLWENRISCNYWKCGIGR